MTTWTVTIYEPDGKRRYPRCTAVSYNDSGPFFFKYKGRAHETSLPWFYSEDVGDPDA